MFKGQDIQIERADIEMILRSPTVETRLHELPYSDAELPRHARSARIRTPDFEIISLAFRAPLAALSERHPSDLTPIGNLLLELLRRTFLPRTGNRDAITTLQQWTLAYIICQQQFDLMDFLLCEIEDVIIDSIKMGRFMLDAHIISYLLASSIGHHIRNAGSDNFMPSVEEWSSMKITFPDYTPAKMGDRRRG